MDILNYITWVKENKIITTISDLNTTLIPIGLKDPRRDDDYLSVGISVKSLADAIGSSAGSVTSVGAVAGAGIIITGTNPITTSGIFTITNSAPDQIVTLSNGDGISTSGTYPNFTISNTQPDQVVTITDGTGISTTGTYPNFTITNTAPSSGGTVTSVELTSGTGISLSGTNPITSSGTINITNSAPDQTVVLNNGTGISISGTYPNFTITNTQPSSGGTVTSVGLTMPSAFSVANSPITGSGTINVTGSGTAGQYVRGDGALAAFPDISGGGGGQVYYLNGNMSQSTILGNPFFQLSTAAAFGPNADFTSGTVNNVQFADFITDIGKPTQETIPAGVWIFQCYLSATSNTAQVYATVEIYDGVAFTVWATSLTETITNGSTIDLYTFTCAVPEYTPLTTTDRVAIRFYATNLGGVDTVTLHTEDSHLGSIQTTFTTGIAAIDGLSAAAQYLQVGTTGSDFNITTSGTNTHVFNLPTASASNRGVLSTGDWTNFNNKQNLLVSGTNIKTLEGQSLLGSGNIDLTKSDVGLSNVDNTSDINKPISTATQTALNAKQDTLVSGTNIKTINGTSVLGSGNITTPSGTITSITASTPLTGGTITSTGTIGISDAAADGITKGAATFTASDFNSTSGVISIDYANGQEATGSTKGFLTAANWTLFNDKQNALNGTGFVKASGTTITYDNSTYLTSAITSLNGLTGTTQTFNTGFSSLTPTFNSSGSIHTLNIPLASTSLVTAGLISKTDYDTFNGKIGGSGTTSYVPRYTASGTIGNSLIQDNTTTVGIGGLLATSQFYVTQSTLQYGIYSTNGYATGVTYGGSFRTTAGKAATNVGIEGVASGSTGLNIGVSGSANSVGAAKNYGGSFSAGNGTNNYAIRLLDGFEGSGKFLKDVTGSGEARWTQITTADISGILTGSGTADYLTKFSASTILANSVIQDNGTTLGIGNIPAGDKKLSITTGVIDYGIYVNGGDLSSIIGIGTTVGVTGSGTTGIVGTGISAITAIGGKFTASGAGTKYSVQLQDGTETVAGRFLKNITTDGKAQWANIIVSDTNLNLTTNFTSGPATLNTTTGTLNIPQYTGTTPVVNSSSNVYNFNNFV